MMNKSPKMCLLGASFGTSNMGVNALTAGTLKAFYEKYRNGELFLIDYGKTGITYRFQRTIPVQLVNVRFSKKLYLKNNIALLITLALFAQSIPFRYIRSKVVSKNYCLRRMEEADVAVSIAGGDSFSDIYGLGRFFYVALPQLFALFMRKKLVLLPQTIGPFQGTVAKYIAKYILKKAEIVYSRDFDGLDVVRNLLGIKSEDNNKLRFCYDVGFVLEPVRPTDLTAYSNGHENKEKPVVGLNISGLLYMGGYSRNNMFGLKIDYKEFVRDVIDHMIRKRNTAVMLVPHVFGVHVESDTTVCEEVYASLKGHYNGQLFIAEGRYDQNEIKYVIGQCNFFIGSRMHACIAALSQNIPTVSIAYSRKFVGVMQTIGVAELVADPRELNKDEMLGIIDDAFEKRALLREHLEKTMPEVKETVLNLFNEIGSLLPSRQP